MIVEDSYVDAPVPGGVMRIHIHEPSGDAARKYPGVVLYSEIYQQTGPIRRAAVRLAGNGYVVAVPEVFHEHEPPGTVLPYDTGGTERGNHHKYATPLATYDRDARTTLDHLAAHPKCNGRLGSIGWCLGGHLALRAALHEDVLATACFYATDIHTDTLGEGKKSDSLARLSEIRGDVVMVWGRQDPHVPDAGRALIHEAFQRAGVTFTWLEVNAVHAFMRDEGPRYDPAYAEIGWALALESFRRAL